MMKKELGTLTGLRGLCSAALKNKTLLRPLRPALRGIIEDPEQIITMTMDSSKSIWALNHHASTLGC